MEITNKIKFIFDLQISHLANKSTVAERIEKLRKLKKTIQIFEREIIAALQNDLRKPTFETTVFEIYFVYSEIDFAIKNLSNWTKSKKVSSNLPNLMADCNIKYEPKGLCLIISPWNYPFQLLISPLVSAISAGNRCILKPSELAIETSKLISKLIDGVFDRHEVAVIEGDSIVASELLKLPFHHIFFTGSTNVGKIVMAAASKNLGSVTLELGGKSPAIIDQTANLKKAADKIAWGKFSNAGQTCIAPDFVFIKKNILNEFIDLLKLSIQKKYYVDNELDLNCFAKIISVSHFERLKKSFEDAVQKDGIVAFGGEFYNESLTVSPTVLTNVSENMDIMQEEIFGPILPIYTYNEIDEVLQFLNYKPLALYVFSNSSKNIDHILNNTASGGVCINDVLLQITNPNLPFGGVNTSGIGSSHGFHGFKNFSHERAIMRQSRIFDISKIVYPPYSKKNLILRFLKKIM